MTEAEWRGGDLRKMLRCLGREASRRKLRLFACACTRRVYHLFDDKRSRRALVVAERHAEGAATDAELEAVGDAAHDACMDGMAVAAAALPVTYGEAWAAAEALADPDDNPYDSFHDAVHHEYDTEPEYYYHGDPAAEGEMGAVAKAKIEEEMAARVAHLRDIFGDPFRHTPLAPALLTEPVIAISRAAYEESDLGSGHLDASRLAVLSDALEEAGCIDADILAHLRLPGPHVRGCWALDLLLGKG